MNNQAKLKKENRNKQTKQTKHSFLNCCNFFIPYLFMHFIVFVLWATGFYCPEGTGFDLRSCPEGTYGPDPGYWSVSQCRQCDGGHYCSSRNGTAVTGLCQEGYYCSHGNTSPRPLSQAAGKQTLLLLPCLSHRSRNSPSVLQF